MKKILALSILVLGIAGCDTQVQKFVDVLPEDDNSTPPVVDLSPNNLKVSPGEIRSTSTSLGLKANVTPTQQKMTSAGLGMQVGISRISK